MQIRKLLIVLVLLFLVGCGHGFDGMDMSEEYGPKFLSLHSAERFEKELEEKAKPFAGIGTYELTLKLDDSIEDSVMLYTFDFKKLKNLRALTIIAPTMKYIPPPLFELRKLRLLNLEWCESLEELPAQFLNFERIEVLKLSGTSITYLSPELSSLKMLHKLEMNHLKKPFELEKSINFFINSNIEYLELMECGITSIPAELHKMKKISSIHFNDNKIRVVPKELLKFTRHIYIDLYLNCISKETEDWFTNNSQNSYVHIDFGRYSTQPCQSNCDSLSH